MYGCLYFDLTFAFVVYFQQVMIDLVSLCFLCMKLNALKLKQLSVEATALAGICQPLQAFSSVGFCDLKQPLQTTALGTSLHVFQEIFFLRACVIQFYYQVLQLRTGAERGICITAVLLLDDLGFFKISVENVAFYGAVSS